MVPGLNFSQKKSGADLSAGIMADLTGELIPLSLLSSGAVVRGTQKSISKI
jgi:hypothetical protein